MSDSGIAATFFKNICLCITFIPYKSLAMRKIVYPFLLSVLVILCASNDSFAQKETRDLPEFTKVSFAISGHLYIRQGDKQSVVLEGDDLDEIVTEVSGRRLKIKRKNSNWWWNNKRVDIYITLGKLEGVSVSGSGKVTGESKFLTEKMDISVSGSGNVELEMEAGTIDTRISGSGKILLTGNTEDIKISISGSGRMLAEDLRSERCKISISGSGSCRIYVTKEIDAHVSGSGNIYYRGDPDKVYHHASGSGSIKKM